MHPEQVYWVAHHLYQGGKYADAEGMFRLLALKVPGESRFWLGLGSCLQMQHQYASAIGAYKRAIDCMKSQDDPYPFVHLADCYLGLNQSELMLENLDRAKMIASKDQKFDNLVQKLMLWEKTHVTRNSSPTAP
jgi:type III secretion system low calcium response chaperone LcrH/SycD